MLHLPLHLSRLFDQRGFVEGFEVGEEEGEEGYR